MMKFGQRLRELRKSRHMTQRTLAASIDLDHTYISKIEAGTMPPPSEVAIWHIARVLDADASELFNLAGKVPARLLQATLNNPLLTELVRLLCERPLSDATYRQLIAIAKESEANHD